MPLLSKMLPFVVVGCVKIQGRFPFDTVNLGTGELR